MQLVTVQMLPTGLVTAFLGQQVPAPPLALLLASRSSCYARTKPAHGRRLQQVPGSDEPPAGYPCMRRRLHMVGATSRRCALRFALASAAAALATQPSLALDPQRDATTARPPPPARLLPILKLKLQVEGIQSLLETSSGWEEAQRRLAEKSFSKREWRRVFDEYSTDNW